MSDSQTTKKGKPWRGHGSNPKSKENLLKYGKRVGRQTIANFRRTPDTPIDADEDLEELEKSL
jgi:hypothetical protein